MPSLHDVLLQSYTAHPVIFSLVGVWVAMCLIGGFCAFFGRITETEIREIVRQELIKRQ